MKVGLSSIIIWTVVLCTLPSVSAEGGVQPYTTTMMTSYVNSIKTSPYVFATASSNSSLVLGQSHGWLSSVPKQNLYGFEITNPSSTIHRAKVVLISGNHNTEYSGNWALQGLVDFLLSSDSRAAQLRDLADIYVYPLVNPDGRYLPSSGGGRGNPELTSLGFSDHNRVWDKTGISTIDAFTGAMRRDTGGRVDFFFDFHDNSAFNELLAAGMMVQSDFCAALSNLAPDISIIRDDGQQGMARRWAMSNAGLHAEYAFTPEFTSTMAAASYQAMGQTYALALYNTLVPEPATLVLLGLGVLFVRKWQPSKGDQEGVGMRQPGV